FSLIHWVEHMIDLNLLRRRGDALKLRLPHRVQPELLYDFFAADERRRAAASEIAELKRQRHEFSAHVAQAKKSGADASDAIEAGRELGQRIKGLEDAVTLADTEQSDLLASIPNIPHESVPAGPDESANVEVRRWGQARAMD